MTKKKVFLAAAKVFAENGYQGASMREVAKEAGIQASSIYNHYKNKESIMNELVAYYLE